MAFVAPTDCPYYLLSRATLVITSALRANMAAAGLEHVKPSYLGVLWSLWEAEGLKVVELGRRAGLEPSTMTGLLDRMERDEFVTRTADPNDRRVQQIHLTVKGRKVQRAVVKVVDRTIDSAFRGIEDDEIEKMKELLRRVLSNAHDEAHKLKGS